MREYTFNINADEMAILTTKGRDYIKVQEIKRNQKILDDIEREINSYALKGLNRLSWVGEFPEEVINVIRKSGFSVYVSKGSNSISPSITIEW